MISNHIQASNLKANEDQGENNSLEKAWPTWAALIVKISFQNPSLIIARKISKDNYKERKTSVLLFKSIYLS